MYLEARILALRDLNLGFRAWTLTLELELRPLG